MKEDLRKNNGGHSNGGRLKKDELILLIESMDAILVPQNVWKALADKVNENDTNAIKLWLSYRYGMPKQSIDIKAEIIDINFED